MEVKDGFESAFMRVHGSMRCTNNYCSREVKFVFARCQHSVCPRCLNSNRGFINGANDNHNVVICPRCQQVFNQYSSWTTEEKLLAILEQIAYCMMCLERDAVYRGRCHHLFCFQCIPSYIVDRKKECSILGCTTIIEKDDVEDLFNRLTSIKMWRKIELPNNQICSITCKEKTVLVFKECKHAYCYPCAKSKLLQNVDFTTVGSNEKVVRCTGLLCRTAISESILNYFLTALQCTELMTAYLLEVRLGECYNTISRNCKNTDSSKVLIRNKSCPAHHIFCSECLVTQKENIVHKAFLHNGNAKSQMCCQVSSCKSTTPVHAFNTMIDALRGGESQVDIFLRLADISEKCTRCGEKTYARFTRISCAHGICSNCANSVTKSKSQWYDICGGNNGKCENIIPVTSFQIMLDMDVKKIRHMGQEVKEELTITLMLSTNEKYGSLNLSADITSVSPIRNIKWLHNKQEMKISKHPEKYLEDKSKTIKPSLTIFDLERDDVGSYSLFVETESSSCVSNEKQFCLPSEKVKITLKRVQDREGNSEILQGKIDTKWPLKELKWQKNGKDLFIPNISSKYSTNMSDVHSPTLTIHNVEKSDEAKYRLSGRSIYGHFSSEELELKIIEVHKTELKKEVLKETGSLKFIFEIHPMVEVKEVQWFKDGEIIDLKNTRKYFNSKNSRAMPTLVIYKINKKDQGSYEVVVRSKTGRTFSKTTEFTIPKDELSATLVLSINEKYGSLNLSADIKSISPIRNIKWLHNEKKMQISKRPEKYLENKNGPKARKPSLTILDLEKEDAGSYSLFVESESSSCVSNKKLFSMPNEKVKIVVNKIQTRERNAEILQGKIDTKWPLKELKWQKNGEDLYIPNISSKYSVNMSDVYNPTLTIHDFEKLDEAKYRLSGKSILGQFLSEELELKMAEDSFQSQKPKNDIMPKTECCRPNNATTINDQMSEGTGCILTMVEDPYRKTKLCRLCEEVAVAEISKCKHRLCLSCIAVLTSNLPLDQHFIHCTDGCSSQISLMAVERFLQRPCSLELETPMYFQLQPGFCGTTNCPNNGIIKARFCNHSFCLDCIQRCKPDERCDIYLCPNSKLPAPCYFEYLISSLCGEGIDKSPPFTIYEDKNDGLFPIEEWKCSFCQLKATLRLVRCGHKMCSACLDVLEKTPLGEYPITIAKCKDAHCSELFPLIGRPSPKETAGTIEATGSHSDTPTNTTKLDTKGKRKFQDDKHTEASKEIQAKEMKKSLKHSGTRGLSNIGFSCYRNSILQILAETPFFLERIRTSSAEKDQQWIVSLRLILEGVRTKSTEENIEHLYRFHHEFNKSNPEFREYEQEDCLSFLTTLLNGIKDACKEKLAKSVDPVELFRGEWRDKYICKKCSKVEYFNESEFLYLPLPYTKTTNTDVNIGSCFLGLLKEEEVDMFTCSTCGFNRMTKELDIVYFPSILVIQLSKLQEVESSTEQFSYEKRSNFVKFSAEFSGLKNKELKKKIGVNTLEPYRLFGVVVHWGSERSGHYICFVRRKEDKKWNRCDDSYVRDVTLDSVLKSNAYLLFYEKCEAGTEV